MSEARNYRLFISFRLAIPLRVVGRGRQAFDCHNHAYCLKELSNEFRAIFCEYHFRGAIRHDPMIHKFLRYGSCRCLPNLYCPRELSVSIGDD